jgi:hypothetical protein
MAFYIAGAIAVFVSQASVMAYLGPRAHKGLAYAVASVSGTVLAVCSCTVLPLFNGIYRMGAGLGPATAFLYSGPAINVLAIVLTARVLGARLGIARGVGAVLFSIVIGLAMHFLFRKEEAQQVNARVAMPETGHERPLWQNGLYFLAMIGVLVFANWGAPQSPSGIWYSIYNSKWLLTSAMAATLGLILVVWFHMAWWKVATTAGATLAAALIPAATPPLLPFGVCLVTFSVFLATDSGSRGEWFSSSWGFARQITPLLFVGVLIAGFLLGTPDGEGVIPSEWIYKAVGGNSVRANFFAALAGAFMYFATLTEVPILQGLIGNGMGDGPALALLLAGPALSLPNMLVIRSVIGWKKTAEFVVLVVVMATLSGIIYGAIVS